MAYRVRGSSPFGAMPVDVNHYGYVAEGNTRNSYGPWVDPELQRTPHRRTALNMGRRKRRKY